MLVPLNAQRTFDRFFDEFYFPFNPTTATASGIHNYDSQLEDYSRNGITKRIAALKKWQPEILETPFFGNPERWWIPIADRDLILNWVRDALLELETIRMWERNPDQYSSGITSSAFTIMSRSLAAPDVRIKALTAREPQMPKVVEDARADLQHPPPS